jgi:Helix-turn-helix domain
VITLSKHLSKAQAGAAAKSICHRLFSIRQAADVAGVPVQGIYWWIKTRKLEAYALEGGIRIDEVELADCISSLAPKQP